MRRVLALFSLLYLVSISTYAFCAEKNDLGSNAYLSAVTGFLGDTVTYTIEIPLHQHERLASTIPFPRAPGLTFSLKNSDIRNEAQGSKHIAVFLFQAFGIGRHTIKTPPITIHSLLDGTTRIVRVPDITYTLESIIDHDEKVRLIENDTVIQVPRNTLNTLIVILCLVSLVIFLCFIYYRVNRSLPLDSPELTDVEPLKPREYAVQQLDRLQKTTLLQEGKRKEFYTRLADIVKQFLGMTLHIEIADRTTSEIITQMNEILDAEELNLLSQIFIECDLVKFAKYQPDYETIIRCLRNTKHFFESVDKT